MTCPCKDSASVCSCEDHYVSRKSRKTPCPEYYEERARLLEIIRAGEQAKAELSALEHRYPMRWP